MAFSYKNGADSHRTEWNSWNAMRHRCRNPKMTHYRNYGGRGITVCDRWFNDFQAFLSDMGPKPDLRYSLDRIDNEQGYYPGNCRWADHSTQARNRRAKVPGSPVKSCKVVSYRGVTLKRCEWEARLGITSHALRVRLLDYGWTVGEALGFEPRPYGNNLHGVPFDPTWKTASPALRTRIGQGHFQQSWFA